MNLLHCTHPFLGHDIRDHNYAVMKLIMDVAPELPGTLLFTVSPTPIFLSGKRSVCVLSICGHKQLGVLRKCDSSFQMTIGPAACHVLQVICAVCRYKGAVVVTALVE